MQSTCCEGRWRHTAKVPVSVVYTSPTADDLSCQLTLKGAFLFPLCCLPRLEMKFDVAELKMS